MCRLITRIRIHAMQHKKERSIIKSETKHEGFSHYNTIKNRTIGTNKRNPRLAPKIKIEEELIRLNLIKPANQENK